MRNLCVGLLMMGASLPAQTTLAADTDDYGKYVRKPRSAAVSLEAGMNSLASLVGLKGTLFVTPQVAVDLGLGVSTTGLRPGVYGRYLFSDAKFTPFAYGGVKLGLGSGNTVGEVEDPDTGIRYEFQIEPSPFLDFGLGIDYLAHNGFYFTGGMGWSHLLRPHNHEWVGVEPPSDLDDMMTFVLGSGLAFFLSLGYAF